MSEVIGTCCCLQSNECTACNPPSTLSATVTNISGCSCMGGSTTLLKDVSGCAGYWTGIYANGGCNFSTTHTKLAMACAEGDPDWRVTGCCVVGGTHNCNVPDPFTEHCNAAWVATVVLSYQCSPFFLVCRAFLTGICCSGEIEITITE